jgi:hypothetical protein
VLEVDILLDGAEIVANVKCAGRLDAGENPHVNCSGDFFVYSLNDLIVLRKCSNQVINIP